jgi:hypothetical protein
MSNQIKGPLMASTQGIRAGRAYVDLLAADKPLEKGLQSAQQSLAKYSSQVAQVQKRLRREHGGVCCAISGRGGSPGGGASGRKRSHPPASFIERFMLAMSVPAPLSDVWSIAMVVGRAIASSPT